MIHMLEIPEAIVLARQFNDTMTNKIVARVIVAQTAHKFAWFNGEPHDYARLLTGKKVDQAVPWGGMVEIQAGEVRLLFSDGISLRFHRQGAKRPVKHQLLLDFTDDTSLSASVQMYGGLWCFPGGHFDNPYYQAAREKISPLSPGFNRAYFERLIGEPSVQKISLKAFLATQQRIPGLGNGVLQDILYNAQIHPKRKVSSLSDDEKDGLFTSVKNTLTAMADQGGRDTEKDLWGNPGGYQTRASKNTAGHACPVCGGVIKKEAYLGGSIYYCSGCQRQD